MFFEVKGRFVHIKNIKKLKIFKVLVIFENENFNARATCACTCDQTVRFFGMKLPKIYLIDRYVFIFDIRKKCYITMS